MSDAPGPTKGGPQTRLPEPPRRPPMPPTPPERGGRKALILGLVGLLTSVPFPLVGIVLSIAAMVVGVRARKRARRVLAPVPGAMAGVVLGAVGLLLCAFAVAVNVYLWDDVQGYEKCRRAALTIDDKQTCQEKYIPRIKRRLHLPPGSLPQYRILP